MNNNSEQSGLFTFAVIGTSREVHLGDGTDPTNGYLGHASAQSGGKFCILFNNSIGGAGSRQFLAGSPAEPNNAQVGTLDGRRLGLAGALASGARFVLLGGVINEAPHYTGLQLWDSDVLEGPGPTGYLQALSQIIANGQTPVLQTEYGQDGLTNRSKLAQIAQYNQLCRDYAVSGQALLVDFTTVMRLPGSNAAERIDLVPGATHDTVHTTRLGDTLKSAAFIDAFRLAPAASLPED